jgi:lipoprotein NlpD
VAGVEPVRHTVLPGETIYSIARLYDVPVSALAAWNGLGRDYTLRPGQVIKVPLPSVAPPGGTTPVTPPPSATDPLPPAPPSAAIPSSPNLSQYRSDAPPAPRFLTPVAGELARPYARNGPLRNDGIDYRAPAGSPVMAADAGEVVLVSKSLDGHTQIVLIRHAGGLTTVYGRIENVTVAKGDAVTRGQVIAIVAGNPTPSLHFEVRRGAESVDPAGYL